MDAAFSVKRMIQTPAQLLSQLSEHLFWDVDRSAVDVEGNARFLITRTMERGTREDVRLVWECYGESRVREALLAAPALTPKTIAFFANQFGLSREAFRAWKRSSQEAV